MTTLFGDAIADFLADRSQEAHTLLGIQVVLVLLVAALLAHESIRTRGRALRGHPRILATSLASLMILFTAIVTARFASLA